MELLREFSMTRIFGNPGSTELPMFRDFPDDFDYVLALQESIAVGMADGYARASRNAAFVNLHSAVGVGHAMGNLFTAWRNQAPLVITAGQQARSILPYEPFLFSERATELPRPYVKWSCEPARAQDVPAAIARAYYTAMQAPAGPVLVSVPVDDWDQPGEPVRTRRVSRGVSPDPLFVDDLAAALGKSARPVVLVGAGVARDQAWDEAIALAESCAAPVWVSPMSSLGSFPEDHRLFAGFLPAMREAIVERLRGHDLVLVLGAPVFTFHVAGEGPFVPEGAELFQVVDNPDVAAWAPVGTAMVGNLKATLQALLAATGDSTRDRQSPARQPPAPLPSDGPLTEALLLQTLAELRPADSIIVEEAPSTRPTMHERLPILTPDTFYTCASGGLGYALPAALGVAMAKPDRRVIALLGDGSCMYAVQGLWNAARHDLSVTFVIVNNGSYRALEDFAGHFGVTDPPGTGLSGLDFADLARAQGVPGVRVSDIGTLRGELASALGAPGPRLLDVQVA
jgi:benzoylformate decarboxylase